MTVLETARLVVRNGAEQEFEKAFAGVVGLVREAAGCLTASIHHSVENPGHYIFLVEWQRIEDHIERFARTEDFQRFLGAIGSHLAAEPEVEHYALDAR